MVTELRALLQKASLPERWAPEVFAEMDRWEEEERGKLQSLARKQAREMETVQGKLDNLVNGYLEGLIDRATYQRKKDELIRQKIGIEGRQACFGERASRWVEPMREWLETAHKAGKLAFSDDYPGMKQILEKIGTNRQVIDKKLEVDFVRPFDSLLRVKALWGSEGDAGKGKKKGLPSIMEESPVLSG